MKMLYAAIVIGPLRVTSFVITPPKKTTKKKNQNTSLEGAQ